MRPRESYRWFLRNVYDTRTWVRPVTHKLVHPTLVKDVSERGEIHYERNGKPGVVRMYDNRGLSPDPGRYPYSRKLNGNRNL